MKTNIEIINFLQSILDVQQSIKSKLIKEFQNEFWNDESIEDEKLNEILSELAYDLDFYEPNDEWREESKSYFGDDRLQEVVRSAMQKIKEM